MTPSEKNKRVAEILGWKHERGNLWCPPNGEWQKLPNYCGNIEAAMGLVEWAHSKGIPWCIEQEDTADKPTVHFINPTQEERDAGLIKFIEHMERVSYMADSLSEAIVNAFLRANGEKV